MNRLVFGALAAGVAYLGGCLAVRMRYPAGYVEPPRAYTDRLYELMGTVDRVFTAHDIPYWIESGTLLGAVRHGGVIPWDDDLDIAVPDTYDDRLESLGDALRREGLALFRYPCGFKIGFIDDPDEADRSEALSYKVTRWFTRADYPYIDILSKRDEGDLFRYTYPEWEKLWPRQSVIHKTELYPLQRYQFGPVEVIGPADPEPYLRRAYGNWESGVIACTRSQRRIYWALNLFMKREVDVPRVSARGSARTP